jgi:hypothetical protein
MCLYNFNPNKLKLNLKYVEKSIVIMVNNLKYKMGCFTSIYELDISLYLMINFQFFKKLKIKHLKNIGKYNKKSAHKL